MSPSLFFPAFTQFLFSHSSDTNIAVSPRKDFHFNIFLNVVESELYTYLHFFFKIIPLKP